MRDSRAKCSELTGETVDAAIVGDVDGGLGVGRGQTDKDDDGQQQEEPHCEGNVGPLTPNLEAVNKFILYKLQLSIAT